MNIRDISRVESGVTLYPNPAFDHVNIDIIKNPEDKVSLEMFDLSGKVIKVDNAQVSANGNGASIIIPVDNLPNATYILRIQVGKEIFAKKVTVAN